MTTLWLPKRSITCLASTGAITLQVSGFGMEPETPGCVEYPSEWFVKLTYNLMPSLGNESGFLHLTKAGWEANKKDIKAAFESYKRSRRTWEEFEKHVVEHFDTVTKKIEVVRNKLQRKLDQLNDMKV